MLPIDSDMALWQAVAGAALVTYGLRVGGRLLAEKLPRTGTFKTFLEALPGTILISLVMPGIMAARFWGWIAATLTAFTARKQTIPLWPCWPGSWSWP